MSTTPTTPEPTTPVTVSPDISAPADDLRAAAVAVEQPPSPVEPAPTEATPVTPEPYSVTTNEDGTVSIKLETGETFTGDPVSVATKLAAAKVNTRRHYERLAQEAATKTPKPPEPVVEPPQESPEEIQAREWVIEQQAKALGMPRDQYVAAMQGMFQTARDMQINTLAASFMQRCPDFPNTPEASEALMKLQGDMNLPQTPDGLEAAHLLAVRRGLYAPLPPTPPPTARPTPAPMLNTGSAPQNTTTEDPWKMDLAKLREQVLNGRG